MGYVWQKPEDSSGTSNMRKVFSCDLLQDYRGTSNFLYERFGLMVSIILSIVAFFGAVCLMHSAKARSRLADNQGKIVALFMIIVVVGVVLIFGSYNGIVWAPLQAVGLISLKVEVSCATDANNCFYGIIIDAGSTGSRIHVYKFQPALDAGESYKLHDELFIYNNDGLSTFAKDPQKGAESLRSMLEKAKEYIPAQHWTKTPIELKATAGLRLLDQKDSDALLKSVQSIFNEYPFKMYENPVSIMDGVDEGIFSWFTLNFLSGALGHKDKMLGILDLGGGSTQITFVPLVSETVTNAKKNALLHKEMFGKSETIYTYSYLGLGLMSGRFQMIGGIEDPDHNDEKNPDAFNSSCLNEGFSDVMKYNGKEYKISGTPPKEGGTRYSECYEASRRFLPRYGVQQVAEVNQLDFVTISYYYDKAVDANIVDEPLEHCLVNVERGSFENGYCEQDEVVGGRVAVKDYVAAAERVCRHPHTKPYLCLDLTYITALLQDGFGFRPETQVILRKKIDNIEITWGLGAIIDIFNTYGVPKV